MTASNNQDIFCFGKVNNTSANEKTHPDARIWNRVAKGYAAKPVAEPDVYAHKLALTREYLHPGAEVLEIGCGTGSTALAHAPLVKHIRATDFSPKMIEIASDKASVSGVNNVDFVCASVVDESAYGAKYDAVLALNLLHLLADWVSAIEAMHHALKPGGVFVTSTMCLNDGFGFMRLIAPIGRRIGVIPQLSFFTRYELEHAMSRAGFEIEHSWQPAPKSGLFLIGRKAL